MLPDVFFKHLDSMKFEDIQWWNHFVCPLHNASIKVGSLQPDQPGTPTLTLLRMSKFQKFLDRFVRLLSVPNEGPQSCADMLGSCELLLEASEGMGNTTMTGDMLRNTQTVFTMCMTHAGKHVMLRLQSDDPMLELRTQFIPATDTDVQDFVALCFNTAKHISDFANVLPSMYSSAPGLFTSTSLAGSSGEFSFPS